ncbi:MAG: hypothetical protein WD059_04355 [Balneolaceae bacterium]
MKGLYILGLLIITCCSVAEDKHIVQDEYVGEWEWYLTAGGWSHPISTDTAGYDMTLQVYNQNLAKWFKDDSLLNRYEILYDNNRRENNLVMYKIGHKESCGFRLNLQEENELHLTSANCTDLPTHFFRRAMK